MTNKIMSIFLILFLFLYIARIGHRPHVELWKQIIGAIFMGACILLHTVQAWNQK